jgi:predicted nucleotidyltransferase
VDYDKVIIIINQFAKSLIQDGIIIDKVILFGSYARKIARKDSDIDLCIISRSFGSDKIKEMAYLFQKAMKINTLIEPIPYSPEQFEQLDYLPIIDEIKMNGIEIPIN